MIREVDQKRAYRQECAEDAQKRPLSGMEWIRLFVGNTQATTRTIILCLIRGRALLFFPGHLSRSLDLETQLLLRVQVVSQEHVYIPDLGIAGRSVDAPIGRNNTDR